MSTRPTRPTSSTAMNRIHGNGKFCLWLSGWVLALVPVFGLAWVVLEQLFGSPVSNVPTGANWFPIHFRCLFLVVAGMWLWIANVKVLRNNGMDVLGIFAQETAVGDGVGSHSSGDEVKSMVQLALLCTTMLAVQLSIYNITRSAHLNGVEFVQRISLHTIANTSLLLWIVFLLQPFNLAFKKERYRFLSALQRIALAHPANPVLFSDVIVADIFTSYSRVFGEIFNACCSFVHVQDGTDTLVNPQCSRSIYLPMAMSIPYFWRFKQCIFDYWYSKPHNIAQLFNAFKYFSVFPTLLTAFLTSRYAYDEESWMPVICTFYALYWDLVHDWDLAQVNSRHFFLRDHVFLKFSSLFQINSSRALPDFIRLNDDNTAMIRFRRFPDSGNSMLYYAAILFNIVARFAWAIRLYLISAGFEMDKSWSVFFVQILELVRRWSWIFFRVEKQWLSSIHESFQKEHHHVHE